MRRFAALIKQLDNTNKTNQKVAALAEYFQQAPKKDALWTIALLSHRRPPRPVTTTLMRAWAAEVTKLPEWLFEESYHIVGDLAETIALLIQQEYWLFLNQLTNRLKNNLKCSVTWKNSHY